MMAILHGRENQFSNRTVLASMPSWKETTEEMSTCQMIVHCWFSKVKHPLTHCVSVLTYTTL